MQNTTSNTARNTSNAIRCPNKAERKKLMNNTIVSPAEYFEQVKTPKADNDDCRTFSAI